MPRLVLWIVRGLWEFGGSIVGQILLTLGLSLAVSEVSGTLVAPNVSSFFSGIPGDVLGYLGVMRVDDAMTVVLSAATVRYTRQFAGRVFFKKRGA